MPDDSRNFVNNRHQVDLNPRHRTASLNVIIGDKSFWGRKVVLETRAALLDHLFRNGTEKAVKLMSQKTWDKATLEDLAQVMRDASICGLGQAASNPLVSALKYFSDELRNS